MYFRFKESGVASFKLRCAKGLRCKVTKVDIEMDKMGAELRQQVILACPDTCQLL